jgi:hypothetical protein
VSAGRAPSGGDGAGADRAGADRAGGDGGGGESAGGCGAGPAGAGPAGAGPGGDGPGGDGPARSGWDWAAWHDAYDDPGSPLSQRLLAVQAWIAAALDQAPPGRLRAVSICAGQGRDLIGVLRDHPRRGDVIARLVELDPRNAATARQLAADAGLTQVEVVTGDAAQTDVYAGMSPANLVLACGVFGNITDEDVARTIRCCAGLCATGGTVVWTRGRGEPDLIPQICEWFAAEDFELLGVSEREAGWGVGAHRLAGTPAPLPAGERMFTFVGADVLRRERGNS